TLFRSRHVLAIAPIHHLTINIGGQTTHLVVNGGNDGDRVLDRINVAELDGNFTDRGQTLHDGFGADVIQLEQDVIAVGATAASFLDFLVHRTRDEIAWSQILERRSVALHEALAILVEQDAAFAANAFGDQHAGTGNTRGVELPELHVFQRKTRTRRHAKTITGIDEGVC